jgi:nitrous oxidase accessory protein NosD
VLGVLAFAGLSGGPLGGVSLAGASPGRSSGAPMDPYAAGAPRVPNRVCGNPAIVNGPVSPPAGAVVLVPPENVSAVAAADGPNTVFWLAPGTYTLGRGHNEQVVPKDGDTFIGAPGAVIDGRHDNNFAFTQNATNVTIEYLTIQNFGIAGGNKNEGVVNHDSATGWHITHNTIRNNAGAGIMIGSGDVIDENCITGNGQYGFNAYSPEGVEQIWITNNEISNNDADNWQVRAPFCGCSGGGKFWETDGAAVTGNYVHGNHDVGLWADTDDSGFDISHNYISGNYSQGIFYEISYNARISENTLVRNGLKSGSENRGNFPISAIYISQSASDRRISGPYGARLEITGNVLINNWSGVVLWEDADRFCRQTGSPCPLVDPARFNTSTCDQMHLGSSHAGQTPVDYYDGCRWHTQNVWVTGNTFTFNPSAVGHGCAASNGCGMQGLFSGNEGGTDWSPYQDSAIQTAITTQENNVFAHNTYRGAWLFMVHDQGTAVPFDVWRSEWHQDFNSALAV